MSAFALLRTATRSSSRVPRSLTQARTVYASRASTLSGRRFYSSDEKPAESSETKKEGETEALTEEQKALAAKDAEILDLTVRPFTFSSARVASSLVALVLNIHAIVPHTHRADYVTQQQTSKTSNGYPSAKRPPRKNSPSRNSPKTSSPPPTSSPWHSNPSPNPLSTLPPPYHRPTPLRNLSNCTKESKSLKNSWRRRSRCTVSSRMIP